MENFPQTYEPTGSMSILEQFVGLKNFMNNKLNSNEYVKTTEQTLTEEQKEQVRENIGVGSSNVIDNVNSTSTTESLSANQGRVLNEKIDSSVQTLNQTISQSVQTLNQSISQNVNELQQDIDANGGDIAGLQGDVADIQGDVSQLNQQVQRSLKTPLSTPAETLIVGIDDNGDQFNLNVRNGLFIDNNSIGVEHPVGSLYFCSHGSNSPSSVFGGTWEKIADNVVLPLGSTAPAVASASSLILTCPQGDVAVCTSQTTRGYGNIRGYYNGTFGDGGELFYRDGINVDLSQSTNAINGIDVWTRES